MKAMGQRLTNATISPDGSTRTETYAYDELNRLTNVNYGDGVTQAYSFDAMGNRLQKQDSATAVRPASSEPAVQSGRIPATVGTSAIARGGGTRTKVALWSATSAHILVQGIYGLNEHRRENPLRSGPPGRDLEQGVLLRQRLIELRLH